MCIKPVHSWTHTKKKETQVNYGYEFYVSKHLLDIVRLELGKQTSKQVTTARQSTTFFEHIFCYLSSHAYRVE